MLIRAKALWATEPTRVVAVVAAILVFLLAKLGVVVDETNVGQAVLLILPILLGGEATRTKVSPAPGPVGEPSDELLSPEAQSGIAKAGGDPS